jgi:hypothetical protein
MQKLFYMKVFTNHLLINCINEGDKKYASRSEESERTDLIFSSVIGNNLETLEVHESNLFGTPGKINEMTPVKPAYHNMLLGNIYTPELIVSLTR